MKQWQQLLADLALDLGQDIVAQWAKPLKILRFDARNLYLQAKDSIQASWFEEHIRPRLKNFQNQNFKKITVHLEVLGEEKKESKPEASFSFSSTALDPSLSLADFVQTPGNTIAHKLLLELTTKNSTPFNPIVLFGPSGSGKTHLLMGTASLLIHKNSKAFYVTADTFTDHVVHAIRNAKMSEFRAFYRDLDVLLIDHIDRFAKRNATQEEFFHTFNTLHTAGKQIVLSSPVPPSHLVEIEQRLISRFEWGITIGLEKIELREILEQKAKLWKLPWREELALFFAETFPQNPLVALQAYAMRAPKGEIPLEQIRFLLRDLIEKEKSRAPTPEKAIQAIGSHFGIKPEDILGKSQMREFAFPRKIAMFICREQIKMPFTAIGKLFERDHSTVMSSVKQIQKELEAKNPEILEVLAKMR